MLTYKTSRPNTIAYLIKQWLISCVILFLPTVPSYIDSGHALKGYYWIVIPWLILSVLESLNTRRLFTLMIDDSKGLIFLVYKTVLSKPKTITLAIKDTRLDVLKRKWNFFGLPAPTTIYFLTGKKEIFGVNKSKDGFGEQTLTQIAATIKHLKFITTKVNHM